MKYRFLLSVLLPLSLSIASCSSDTSDCEDGTDNDGDGLIDLVDPGCVFSGGATEFPDPAACQDGLDNDADGLIDLDDPGCQLPTDDDEVNTVSAACADGIDNDSDGLIDFPNDPGCVLSLSDSEADDCPAGATCPQCGNGVDDDADGVTDYPDDLGCNSASDNDEFNADPSICGSNVLIQPLPASGEVMGRFADTGGGGLVSELISTVCGGGGEEHVFIYTLTGPRQVVITTDFADTEVDTILYLRSDCSDQATELGCNDDIGTGRNSTIAFDRLDAGTYYIVVDTQQNESGNYRLNVDTFTPEKEPCDPAANECAPGLVCRNFTTGGVTATSETCEMPECSDGEDSDGDGLADFPNEPGCTSLTDNDETDNCPTGPNCPACGNGVDDDADLLVDFPADPGCSFAADGLEIDECIPGVLVDELTSAGLMGTTPIAADGSNFSPSCSGSTSSTEDVYAFRAPRDLSSLTFSTIGSVGDTVLSVRTLECGVEANEIACEQEPNGGESITIPNVTQGEFYFVFVDGNFVSGINYQLGVSGTLLLGDDCDLAETAFVCDTALGLACKSDVCAPAECSDGINNDPGNDALIDLFDPGCENSADDDESDDPVTPRQCSDGIDNDMDGDTDYPDDIGCAAAADDLEESCDDSDPIVEILASPVTGTTVGSTNDYSPSCQGSSTAGEIAHRLVINVDLLSLSIDTNGSGYDTVLTLNSPECSSTEQIDCNDDGGTGTLSLITVQNPPQGLYYVLVDGFGGGTGAYILNVAGVITPGGACDPTSSLFSCSSGEACDGATSMCVTSACNDGIDNDMDGLTDYPDEPGCDSISDNDETDDCPNGANCPQCSNGIDDDMDTFVDYPADIGCASAADDDEVDECSAGVPLLALDDLGVTGTTEASGNSDTSPSCSGSTTASEDEYAYRVTQDLVTLSFSTVGSTGDTVLSVRRGACDDVADEIACANDTVGETVTVTDSVNGELLYVFVDGDFVSGIDYVLNVSGTLGIGEPCDVLDTQFVCDGPSGLSCDGSNCVPSECADGVDNDMDGLIDAFDSGCANLADDDESDDPVPETECVDGVDNDADGETDYPADLGCVNAADDLEESCLDTDPVLTVNAAVMTGTTTGAVNDWIPTCRNTSTAPDHAFEFLIPGDLQTLTVSTDGSAYDTVVHMRIAECSGLDLACDDDSGAGLQALFTSTNVPAGLYYIIVDGFGSNSGAYTLNVSGVIRAGEACDPTQIAGGFLSCATGTSCMSDICQ